MPSSSSKTEARALPEQVVVGVVVRPHGVRGAVVVEPLSDTPERFAPGAELELVTRGGARRRVTIAAAGAPIKSSLRLRFESVDDRDAAEDLRGARLEVPRAAVPAPPAGAHYHYELVGCRCRDRRAGELGTVVDVVSGGGGWLLVVERPDGGRIPLPFVERFLIAVDREAGRIEWDLPEGLIAACASRS